MCQRIDQHARPSFARALVGLALLAALAPATWASGLDLSWFTVFPGGGDETGGRFHMTAVIGQPVASEPMTGHRYELTGGYLSAMMPHPSPTPTPDPTPARPDYWLAY